MHRAGLRSRSHGKTLEVHQAVKHPPTRYARMHGQPAFAAHWTPATLPGAHRTATPGVHGTALPSMPIPGTMLAARNTAPATDALASGTGTFDRGESHPEDDRAILLAAPKSAPSAVVRAATATQAVADDTPRVPVSKPRIVTGFGAEVAMAAPPSMPKSKASPSSDALPETPAELENLVRNDPATARAITEAAMQPTVLPVYTRSGKLIMPPPLKGSREVLVHQNLMADHDGLERIQNDRELDRLLRLHLLVAFPENESLRVNHGLPEDRRYARPWTVKFATDIARAFYAEFGEPVQVNSAVRTVSYQLRLQRVNGNAAAANGEGASPHLTGQAIDLAKRGLSMTQIAWMRNYLTPLIEAGKVDVEEEFQQACFHVSVYRSYMPVPRRSAAPAMQVAQYHASRTAKPAVRTSDADEEDER